MTRTRFKSHNPRSRWNQNPNTYANIHGCPRFDRFDITNCKCGISSKIDDFGIFIWVLVPSWSWIVTFESCSCHRVRAIVATLLSWSWIVSWIVNQGSVFSEKNQDSENGFPRRGDPGGQTKLLLYDIRYQPLKMWNTYETHVKIYVKVQHLYYFHTLAPRRFGAWAQVPGPNLWKCYEHNMK